MFKLTPRILEPEHEDEKLLQKVEKADGKEIDWNSQHLLWKQKSVCIRIFFWKSQ